MAIKKQYDKAWSTSISIKHDDLLRNPEIHPIGNLPYFYV